jgi:hypothetical protein
LLFLSHGWRHGPFGRSEEAPMNCIVGFHS